MVDPVIPTRKEIQAVATDADGVVNQRMARALEKLFEVAGTTTPATIEVLTNLIEAIAFDAEIPVGNVFDYVDFSPNGPQATVANRAKWNATNGTVNLGLSDTTATPIGQEVLFWVENDTGSTLAKGKVVRLSTVGTGDYMKAILYTAGSSVDAGPKVFGLVKEDIPTGSFGYVINQGVLAGVDTSAYTTADELYATSSGNLTATRPTAPTLKIMVGYAGKIDATNGTIIIKPFYSGSISRLHDVDAATPVNGELLIWNNTNTRYDGATLTAGNGTTITNAAGSITVTTNISGGTGISISGTNPLTITNTAPAGGASGSFTTTDGKTVTVVGGLVTSIV